MNTSRPVVKTDPEVCGVLEPLVDGVGNDIHASYQYGGAFGRASDDDDGDERENWISWFCSLKGHDWFAEIEEEYIRDSFNLYGLKGVVNNFERALEMILGDAPGDRDLMEKRFFDLYKDAVDLYGLIHARYIISPRGLSQMKDRWMEAVFGHCPRVLCNKHRVLPVGISADLKVSTLRSYCPFCREIYEVGLEMHVQRDLDGAYFGPSFPHIFLQTYVECAPTTPPIPFQPRVFGFRMHGRKSIIQIKLENGEYGADYIPRNRQAAGAIQNKEELHIDED